MEINHGKKGSQTANKPLYAEQHLKLQEMGFDSKSIQAALQSTSGDLQAATAILLGEPAVPAIPQPAPAKSVLPMKVVGKQTSTAPRVVAKVDIKETHNKFMATYKVQKCKDKTNHDKRMCFHYHAKGDRRRNPFEILYTCTECPNSSETVNCDNGDACLKAHNMLERMFHPDLFKISMCQRGPNGSHCERGNLCAFAHSDEDHRIPSSHAVAKPAPTVSTPSVAPVSISTHTAASAATAAAATAAAAVATPSAAADTIVASKSMTDSRMLDMIQDKLVNLIKNQGQEGIISSELPKRYYDAYAERLDLADEAGEKFRIKDLLLSHANISMTMHKGVQPKYVYEEVEAPAPPVSKAASKAAAAGAGKGTAAASGNGVSAGISYSAITTQNVKPTGKALPAPLNYAAAAAPPAPVAAAPAAASVPETTTETPTNGAPAAAAVVTTEEVRDVPPKAASQWSGVSLLDGSMPGPAAPLAGSHFVPVGGRRRGPEEGNSERADTATPPTVAAQYGMPTPSQLSPASVSTPNFRAGALAGGSAAASPGAAQASPSSNAVSPGKVISAATMAEYHERLAQANNSCEKLAMQVQLLQGELGKRSKESELHALQVKGMMNQLNESAEMQNKANSAKDAAISEVFRVRHELEEMKNQDGDATQKNRDIAKDVTIAQLRQEKTAELNQFCLNLSQIESALIEMQRKEARFINEIPLHDTINESSRARDELTKFVSMLKQQMSNKIMSESVVSNASNGNAFLKTPASAIGGLGGLLGVQPQMATADAADIFGSPLRSSFLPTGGYLGSVRDGVLGRSLLGTQTSSLLGDDLGLMMQDSGDAYSLLLGGAPGVAPSNAIGTSRVIGSLSSGDLLASSNGSSSNALGSGRTTTTGSTLVCALPGCNAGGTFVCSACNRSGYCGAQHQRDHWIVHMKECGGM